MIKCGEQFDQSKNQRSGQNTHYREKKALEEKITKAFTEFFSKRQNQRNFVDQSWQKI